MNDDNVPMWFVVIIALLAWIVGLFVGSCSQSNYRDQEAIKAGVGEYYLDQDHNKQFRFKKP